MLEQKTVLIVEDDLDLAELLDRRCRALGLTTLVAHDAFQAVDKAELFRPDIVLSDVGLPKGNGLAFTELLSDHPVLGETPVIVLTAKTTEQVIKRCHEIGAYYVPKGGDLWNRVKPLLTELLASTDGDSQAASLRVELQGPHGGRVEIG